MRASFAFLQAIEMVCLLFDDYQQNLKPVMSPQHGLVLAAQLGVQSGSWVTSSTVGDSRFILSYDGIAHNVSLDHKPMRRHEKQRILKAGGNLEDGRICLELHAALVT